MLWSLIKIVLFIAIIAGLTLGAEELLGMDGGIRVAIGNIEFNLGPFQAVIALGLLVIVIWIALKVLSLCVAVLKFLNGDETALSRWWNRSRERRGFEALADGLMALASGESRVAMAKAQRAERYLGRPELTNLITAQAAEMSGDTRKAEEVYRLLLADDRTRFVGVRGIMKQKLAEGDTSTAAKLAEKAFALKPRHEETQDVLLKLQANKGDWTGARKTLGAKLRYGTLPRDVHRRRDAVLALGEAKSIVEEGKTIEAREAAITANKLSPDLVPAAVMAAGSYTEQGQKKFAQRVISKAWNVQPHPDLATAFAAIEPDEKPDARVRRFQILTSKHVGHPETKMLLAELYVSAERFPEARAAMGDLAETDPTKRSLTLMAAIARGEGADDSVVNSWLTKALTASPGPQWICEVDGKAYPEWRPMTDGGFDTLTWKTAPVSETVPGNAGSMLPLIAGQFETTPSGQAGDSEGEVTAESTPDAPEDLPGDGPAPDHANHDAPPPASEDLEVADTAEQSRK